VTPDYKMQYILNNEVCGPYAESFVIFYNNTIETAYLPKDSTVTGRSFILDIG
jgi:hypothetical protein